MALRQIAADEFARRMKADSSRRDKRFAFFLGAGCSVSSGIPTAGTLTSEVWIPELCALRAPQHKEHVETWARQVLPEYDPEQPAASYGPVLEQRFLTDSDRQQEIERLCDGRFPAFGYAVLANLIAMEKGHFNVALTTNFDDLIGDALYLFTSARPLVIPHESLAGFIRPTSTKPLIVKLHGDHRLAPRNLTEETASLKEGIERSVHALLHDRGLIVIGYGGNDRGIAKILVSLPSDALPHGVYWVSPREPVCVLTDWLTARHAIWVQSADFDELMLLIRDEFGLPHPDRGRFEQVFEKYAELYGSISKRVQAAPDSAPNAPALKQAAQRTDKSFPSYWMVILSAESLDETDPDEAERQYLEGLNQFPGAARLLRAYAEFLQHKRKDMHRAEEYYRRAVEADPRDANHLSSYAFFLQHERKDMDRAEEYYRLALEADPRDANHLSSYAFFLQQERKDMDRAEEFYRRAMEADPSHANHLANYAGVLLARGSRRAEGLNKLTDAISMLPRTPEKSLLAEIAVELWFYALAHRPPEARPEALRTLKRLLVAGARSPLWDLSANVSRAKADRHPDAEWLPKVAAVIGQRADISTLEQWSAWRNA